MERKWSVRTYKEGDEMGILDLWKAVYPDREYDWEKWLRWWHWLYKENPAGQCWICMANDGGKIAGQTAVIPIVIKIGTMNVLSSQEVDAMTHPDYRGQGMYKCLALRAYSEAAKSGVHTRFQFPNDASYPIGTKKLDWIKMPNMNIMLKVFNWNSALKLKVNNLYLRIIIATVARIIFNKIIFRTHRLPVIDGLTITKIKSWDDRVDKLWANVSSQYQIMVVRDKSYLNWRYSAPDVNYSIFAAEKTGEICGYLVLQHTIQRGLKISHIFDLIAQSEDIMQYLVAKAVEECQQKGIDIIRYPLIANKIYHRILKNNGFIFIPFLKGGHFCTYTVSKSISREFISNPRNWLVQIGDSDNI